MSLFEIFEAFVNSILEPIVMMLLIILLFATPDHHYQRCWLFVINVSMSIKERSTFYLMIK